MGCSVKFLTGCFLPLLGVSEADFNGTSWLSSSDWPRAEVRISPSGKPPALPAAMVTSSRGSLDNITQKNADWREFGRALEVV